MKDEFGPSEMFTPGPAPGGSRPEPEKAVLDVVHLQPGGDRRAYLEELRLDFDTLRLDRLEELAATCPAPKLVRAARVLRDIACLRPFLERGEDIELVGRANVLRLLT